MKSKTIQVFKWSNPNNVTSLNRRGEGPNRQQFSSRNLPEFKFTQILIRYFDLNIIYCDIHLDICTTLKDKQEIREEHKIHGD